MDAYLYVENQDDFSRVPEALLKMLGRLDWAMDLDLSQKTQLANANIDEVIRLLKQDGFYLQLPPAVYREG